MLIKYLLSTFLEYRPTVKPLKLFVILVLKICSSIQNIRVVKCNGHCAVIKVVCASRESKRESNPTCYVSLVIFILLISTLITIHVYINITNGQGQQK